MTAAQIRHTAKEPNTGRRYTAHTGSNGRRRGRERLIRHPAG